jgi:hypothetical protein
LSFLNVLGFFFLVVLLEFGHGEHDIHSVGALVRYLEFDLALVELVIVINVIH